MLLALVAAELGLRVEHSYRRTAIMHEFAGPDEQPTMVPSDIPGLIYTRRPGTGGANSRGYVDQEHALEKPAGVFRLVVIGDSVALGHGVGPQRSFAKLLEQSLNRSYSARKFEVIVLAQSGYGTSQELVVLQREAFQYSPDLILWSYVLNDPADPVFEGANGELGLLYEPKCYLLHLAAKAYFRVWEAAKARGGPQEYHQRLHYVHWDEVVENIGRIGRVCRQHGVPAVLVIHPIFEENKNFADYGLAALHHRLGALATQSGLLPLDVLDAYRKYASSALGLPHDCWHPNARGHEVAAEFLHRKLTAAGGLLK
jgi:hypothetical protein